MAYPVVEDVWLQRARNTAQPLWLRVVAVAEANKNQHGHCPLTDGWREVARCVGDPTLSASNISKAVARAIEMGWLHPATTSRCLLLTTATRDLNCEGHPLTRGRRG